ncbi:MAG: glycosyltransferase, partial [Calditrichaeota bacterium]
QIDGLVRKLEQGCDLVMGWRHPRKDWPLNQTISRVFNWLIKRVSKIELNDVNSGVFAARRDVLEDVPMYGNLNIFLPILAARKGYVVSDEKIAQLPGEFRKSKYLTEYIQRLLDIVTVIFLTNYSKKPLHFLGFIGLVFALVGGLMNLYLFFYRVFQFGPIAGRPLLLLGALLLVIGIQMISIGLIGEMIIFTHAKEIKEYTIEEILE